MKFLLILECSYLIVDMNVTEYLSNIFLEQNSIMMSDFIYVIFPVLSITVLMFSLRTIVEGYILQECEK